MDQLRLKEQQVIAVSSAGAEGEWRLPVLRPCNTFWVVEEKSEESANSSVLQQRERIEGHNF